jgi:hypothetical protein
MIALSPTPDPSVVVALALTAAMAMSSRRNRWRAADIAARIPGWMPWAVLATLAVTSMIFAVTQPHEFAAMTGQGLPDPDPLSAALGQL